MPGQVPEDVKIARRDALMKTQQQISLTRNQQHVGELGLRTWNSMDHGHAVLTIATKYLGNQYLDNTASTDRMPDAYLVNDVRANITLLGLKGMRSIDLNITVRNIFSELYESNGWVYSYVHEGRRQEMIGLYPQAPINVLGGASVRF